jgi:hypothetical protein
MARSDAKDPAPKVRAALFRRVMQLLRFSENKDPYDFAEQLRETETRRAHFGKQSSTHRWATDQSEAGVWAMRIRSKTEGRNGPMARRSANL